MMKVIRECGRARNAQGWRKLGPRGLCGNSNLGQPPYNICMCIYIYNNIYIYILYIYIYVNCHVFGYWGISMVYPWYIPMVVPMVFIPRDLQDKPRPPMVLPVKRLDFVLHRAGRQKWMTSL